MKTLVLGLGNPLLGDDGVGIRAAEFVRQRLPPDADVEVDVDYWGGLRLMERLVGYDRAVIIDALCTRRHAPGSVLHLGPADLPTQHTASMHDMNLPTALKLAETLKVKVPGQIDILAVAVERVLDFDEQCTPAVSAALPEVAQAVVDILCVGSHAPMGVEGDELEYAAHPKQVNARCQKLEAL